MRVTLAVDVARSKELNTSEDPFVHVQSVTDLFPLSAATSVRSRSRLQLFQTHRCTTQATKIPICVVMRVTLAVDVERSKELKTSGVPFIHVQHARVRLVYIHARHVKSRCRRVASTR